MHRLLALVVTAVVLSYALGAVYFFRQEQWARDPASVLSSTGESEDALVRARHPEAILGTLQERFARQRFGEIELGLVTRALGEVPSFYQSPFLLATYHASRLEAPAAVRAAYEAALDRYPANGRLHFSYAVWLFEARTNLAAWRDPEDPARLVDPGTLAEAHLARSMELESDLSWKALDAMETYRVPAERWAALTPEDALSRRHLVDVLFRAGHDDAGLDLLRESLAAEPDLGTLRHAAELALRHHRPELALEAALRWQAVLESEGGARARSMEPALAISRAHFALGDTESSNRVLDEALAQVSEQFGPSSRVTLDTLCAIGSEYLSRGQTFSAEGFYSQAVSRSPSHVPALVGLARSLMRSGDVEGAISRYEEVLRLDPDHEAARNELKRALVTASRG